MVDGTRTYHYPNGSKKYSNHGVEIIGWDDNYPKENFKYEPEGNGAWLIKNSGEKQKNMMDIYGLVIMIFQRMQL